MAGYFNIPPIPTLAAKAPYDIAPYLLDFTNVLASGDSISSIASAFVNSSGLVVVSSAITSGYAGTDAAVVCVLASGVLNTFYQVTAEVVTTFGDHFARSIYVPVASL